MLLHTQSLDDRPHRNGETPPLLSVVIPVYNERKTLLEIIRRVREVPVPKELVLIDDGSTDGTRDLLATLTEPDLVICLHPHNRGKGAALRTGFARARGEIVLVQDADLEYDPADYPRLLQPILEDAADVVFGSRFKSRQARSGQVWWHVFGNRALTALSNLCTGLKITDMETGYKVMRRTVIQSVLPALTQDRFGIEPELTAKLAHTGCRIREVPIRYAPRSYQDGKKIGWRDALQAVWCILRYRRRND
jgi:glycosyltransferase involved in cell wall biosynthesis